MGKFIALNADGIDALYQGIPCQLPCDGKIVAVLSSTLLQLEGAYEYTPLEVAPDVVGIPHFVGHPATRFLLDQAGAVYTAGLFAGLSVGQAFIVCQLKDPRKGNAFTVDSPGVTPDDLKWGLVTRLA